MIRAFFLVCICLFCKQVYSGVSKIKGEAINYSKGFIVLQKPINGYYNNFSYDKTDTVDLKGNKFNIEVDCIVPVFVTIFFGNHPVWLIISPGDSIAIFIDFSLGRPKEKVYCKISGSNEKGQNLFYYYNYWPAEKYENIWKILKSDSLQIISDIKREITRQIKPFQNLYLSKKIDKSYYELVSSTITSLLLFESIRKILDLNISNLRYSSKFRKLAADKLFNIFNPFDDRICYGLHSSFYRKIFLSYQRAQKQDNIAFNKLPDTTVICENIKFKISGDFSSLLYEKDTKIREVLFGSQILDYLGIGGGVEILLDEIKYFEISYPNSPYSPFIKKLSDKAIQNVYNYNTSSQKFFDLIPVTIIDSTGHIKNIFTDFYFSSEQVIYVDVWATWCGPCIREMKYNFEIDSFLYANKINRLYISIDKIQDTIKWKKTIFDMKLAGYHIIAGEDLQKLLTEKFGVGSNLIAIPIYFILKNGKVINHNAFPPSEVDKAMTQLLGVLRKVD